MNAVQSAFLVALVVASLAFVAGLAYFLHLPKGLKGWAAAGTYNPAAVPVRFIFGAMLLALGLVAVGWFVLASGYLAFK